MSEPDLPGCASSAAARSDAAPAAGGALALGARRRPRGGVIAYFLSGHRPRSRSIGTAAQTYPSQAYTVFNATGYVVAQRKAAVASKATGRLEWLGVREGSAVNAGEVLARLENRDVTAQMEQAAANIKVAEANLEQGEAELKDAERALKRSAELLEKKFVPPRRTIPPSRATRERRPRWRVFGAAIAAARANHRAAQVAVEQTLIRAPFDGVVLTKNANVGDVITPFSSALGSQAAVVTMADMSTLEVEADVAERTSAKCGRPAVRNPARRAAGQPLPRRSAAARADRRPLQGDRDGEGALHRQGPAHPAGDERQSRFPVEGRAGGRTRPAIAVRASAVVERERGAVVYVVSEGAPPSPGTAGDSPATSCR